MDVLEAYFIGILIAYLSVFVSWWIKTFIKLYDTKAKCKLYGHRRDVSYHKGEYNGIQVKFILAHCDRCRKGLREARDTTDKMTKSEYGTYAEEYFDK